LREKTIYLFIYSFIHSFIHFTHWQRAQATNMLQTSIIRAHDCVMKTMYTCWQNILLSLSCPV